MSFQAYLDNINAKTGKTPENFKQLAQVWGLLKPSVKASEVMVWLKEDFDLGHGHAIAYYNVERRHSSLGYLAPNHFETRFKTTSQLCPP